MFKNCTAILRMIKKMNKEIKIIPLKIIYFWLIHQEILILLRMTNNFNKVHNVNYQLLKSFSIIQQITI